MIFEIAKQVGVMKPLSCVCKLEATRSDEIFCCLNDLKLGRACAAFECTKSNQILVLCFEIVNQHDATMKCSQLFYPSAD
jgi:hypothetical protein